MFPKARQRFERARLQLPRSLVRLTAGLVAALALAAGSPFPARAQKPAGANVTADLPAGPMQAKATTACLECHEARIILQQRLSKAPGRKKSTR